MNESISKLRDIHERLNGASIPLEVFFQSSPDFMIMFRGDSKSIRHVNDKVCQVLGWKPEEFHNKSVWEYLVYEGTDPLPNSSKKHSRFLGKLRKKSGEEILLDFNSTYLSDGDFTIVTGRYPLAV